MPTIDELERQVAGEDWGFHDALLTKLEMNWARSELAFELRVQLGKRQDADRLGRITVSGVQFFVAAPPAEAGTKHGAPWIDSGPGKVDDTPLPPVPHGHFLHHLYGRDPLQVFYVCGRDARFSWLEEAAVPKAPEAFYPGDEVP